MSLTESEVSKMVRDAIVTADYKANGAPFKPFKIKAGNASDFTSIWFNEERGNNDIRFYGFNGQRTDGYLPLGDVAVSSKELKMDEAGTLLFSVHPDFANDGSAPLAHPVGFEFILDDYGTSQDDKNLFYWRPIAPQGYSALGICFTPTAAQPDPTRYWCVNNSFVEEVTKTTAWNDSGTHWSHNGNLDAPTLKNEQLNGNGLIPGQVRIIPNTFFSEEGASMRALAVRADQCYLSVPSVSAISPSFDDSAGDGSFTEFGLDGKIAVLPFIGVKNRSPKAPVDSPFYYLACEPYFQCLKSLSTSGGGSEKLTYEVGTSHTESSQYKETTGLTIGASVGYTAGQSGGVGGSISVSFSKTWEVGNESSTTDSSSQAEETIVNFKAQPTTQIWQRRKHMAVYSTDGVKIAEVDYNTKDIKFVPE
jgi:hypothetical protein